MTRKSHRFPKSHIAKSLAATLNSHGYSFQYRVIDEVYDLNESKGSPWSFGGAEHPVQKGGQDGHIDLICYSSTDSSRNIIILVGECKRVDTSRSNWCFVGAPYTIAGKANDYVQFDQIKFVHPPGRLSAFAKELLTGGHPPIATHGFTIKSGLKGDGIFRGDKNPINAAIAQVLRNTAGLVGTISDRLRIDRTHDSEWQFPELANGNSVFIVPVVFTTAKLFFSKVNLADANLDDGLLDPTLVEVEEHDWLWFNENRSVGLSHDLPIGRAERQFSVDEFLLHTRTVAIVNPSGMKDFLSKRYHDHFFEFFR